MRLIDADALIEKWYEVNNIGPEDRGAIFIGYTEIPRFINNAPTVEPTGDLISRADAIEAVAKFCVDGYKAKVDGYFIPLTDALINTLSALPSADAVSLEFYEDAVKANIGLVIENRKLKEQIESAEAVQGEWIFNPTDAIDLMFAKPKCSRCGFESSDGGNFCPNCGTRMGKESEE